MKNTMIIAAGLLLTSSAFASTMTVNQQTSVDAGTFATKSAAYQAGFNLADSIKSMDKTALRKELSLWTVDSADKLGVDNSNVVVKEFATNPDNIQYRAIVNVDYHFNQHENN